MLARPERDEGLVERWERRVWRMMGGEERFAFQGDCSHDDTASKRFAHLERE
jgi:hypothetical protein